MTRQWTDDRGMKHRVTMDADGNEHHVIDPGRRVVCDYCGEDYTESEEHGGLLFQSKAVCPKCTPRTMELVRQYHEERFIRGVYPEGKSFADWIREDVR